MIPQSIIDQINQAAKLHEVVLDVLQLKKSGKDYVGACPMCDSKKGFSLSPSKVIAKCFSCGKAYKGVVAFIQDVKKLSFPDALKWVADKYNISLEAEPVPAPKTKHARIKSDSFRNQQLKSSGLDDSDQKCLVKTEDADKEIEIDRYQAGSVNDKWDIIPGDDMVMHYVDLYGRRVQYLKPGTNKMLPLIRVRWSNPAIHLDKDGHPMKYKSPYGSGSHLWVPNTLRNKFQMGTQFDTLYVHEGEKKADKATKHGMISVGIMGIHNLASNRQLPHEFELIIKKCGVKNVVFFVDSDFTDISSNPQKPADARPKSFLGAVQNFHDYFYAFNNIGIHLELYFSFVKKNDARDKGIDDLLSGSLRDKEQEFLQDIGSAMNEKDGAGKYVQCHKITGKNNFQLREYFHLQNNEKFAEFHKEELKKRGTFMLGKLRWKFNDTGGLELAQPLMPTEEFWKLETWENSKGKEVQRINFHYGNCYNFLRNRHFGRMQMSSEKYKFIKLDSKVVQELAPYQVKDFLLQFAEEAVGRDDVMEMLYRGARMYLGPESLSNLKFINPSFHRNQKGVQYLYFKNKYWKITSAGIEEKPIADLDGYVWSNSIIEFDAAGAGPLTRIEKITGDRINELNKKGIHDFDGYQGQYSLDFTAAGRKCHFAQFLFNTGNFFKEAGESLSPDQLLEIQLHFVNKMTAIGYLLHRFRDRNVLKAIVAMDGKMSEVGASYGRSGKSLIADALEKVVPSVLISGKRRDLTEDKYIFDQVDERTHIVCIDDVRVNVDFEFFFPIITGKMTVEGKGIPKYQIPADLTPKLFITTNHALNGDGGSFRDRQHLTAFSDYYNEDHRPVDDFGQVFFDEWDYTQWNLFYNFMAECLQAYFRFGLVEGPSERLELRRMRQQIGESMIEWADMYFDNPDNLDNKIPRKEMMAAFMDEYPDQKKYMKTREFKKRLRLYCQYKGIQFNPPDGKDIKSDGIEFFVIKKSII